jgi:glutaredoxin-related protein
MKTPFEQKLEHFQKSFVGDDNMILKSDGTKSTPQEYIKGLGAEKFNPGKLKREMEHHKNMAGMTGDAGHMHVYEHLSKMHKDHPVHKEGDAMEKKTLSAAKAKETKTKNAKSKAKAEKEAVKAKTDDPKKKGQVKPDNKDKKDKPLKEEEKYSSPEKKDVKGKVDPKKKDDKHVEVKVVVNKSEHELELLSQLGISKEDLIEKAKSKYGKGKKTVQIAVKGKNKVYYKNQVVGTKDEPAKNHNQTFEILDKATKINKNATVGGGTKFGAALNNLVTKHMAETGMGKGAVLTEVALYAGYGVNSKGVKVSDPKSSIYQIIKGNQKTTPIERKKKIAEFFGHTVQEMHDIEIKTVPSEKVAISEVDIDEVTVQASGFNYKMIKELRDGDMPRDKKFDAFLKQGLRNGGIIARLLNDTTPYDVIDTMKERGIAHMTNDGFDMAEMRTGSSPGIKRRSVQSLFAGYRAAVNRLVNRDIGFVFAYGAGGVGKTWHADNVFDDNQKRAFDWDNPAMEMNGNDYDYVVVTGRGGMGEAIKHFYNHRDKLIVFDDYDSMVKPNSSGKSDMANILKAAFDSGKSVRRIMHGMQDLKGDNGDVIPPNFRFNGNALMITNLTRKEVPQPILSRTGGNIFDLSMNLEERLELVNKIWETDKIKDADGKPMDIPISIRKQALDFMNEHAYDKVLLDFNEGASISPRLFKGLAVTMKDFSQMDEKTLIEKLGADWEQQLPEVYFDTLLQGM